MRIQLLLAILLTGVCEGSVSYSYQHGPDPGPAGNNDFHGLILGQDATTPFANNLDFWWASQFYTVAGGESISSITLGFNPSAANLPVSFLLYSDQNGNGLADSLSLLGQLNGTLPAFSPVPFAVEAYYTLTFGTPIPVGTSFFTAALFKNIAPTVTCYITNPPQTPPCLPDVTVDLHQPEGHSWWAYNTKIPNTFNVANPMGAEGFVTPADSPWNFTLSAIGVAGDTSGVPEPSSIALVGAGVGLIGWIRRRRKG